MTASVTRDHATFEADFPDDSVEDERGDVTIPAGKNIAEFLAEALRNAGHNCTRPEQHSFYGWSFEVVASSWRVWFLLQYPGPWLLMAEVDGPFLATLLGKRSALEGSTLHALDDAMHADQRFAAIRWYTKKEYEAGSTVRARVGHPSPD